MTMNVYPIQAFEDNYIWLLREHHSSQVLVVDPGDAQPVLTFLQKNSLQLTTILITHHHWDHCGGVVELKKHFDVDVFSPAREPVEGTTKTVQEGDVIKARGFETRFKVLDIPGHTKGHIAYYAHPLLFCGDTLFTSGCGRLFEGTYPQLYASLQKLARLPEDTLVYCGHEYTEKNLRFAKLVEPNNQLIEQRLQQHATVPATLAIEKQTNPFLRCDALDVKQSASTQAKKILDNEIAVFTALRQWKDRF